MSAKMHAKLQDKLQRSGARPRVEGDREQEIFDATLDLVAEAGYDRLTLDAVATRVRASKATLYRRWSSKAELVVDAIAQVGGHVPELPDTGSLRGDFLATISRKKEGMFDPRRQGLFLGLITAMTCDAELGAAVRNRLIAPVLASNAVMLERARDRGEIDDGVDLDMIGAVLPALILYRLTVTCLNEPLDAFATRVIDEIVLPAVRKHS